MSRTAEPFSLLSKLRIEHDADCGVTPENKGPEFQVNGNEYAQIILSDEGQHNGLYWAAAAGESQSPIGPLVASAFAEGYAKSRDGAPTPYAVTITTS